MTPPHSVSQIVAVLNQGFYGYDRWNPSSASGITITWLKDTDSKLELYCSAVPGNDADGCYQGSADCRMSGMIHNHQLPLEANHMLTFAGRNVGVVFNQELVEKYFGKCSFIYDGASNNRYNHGCGAIPAASDINCDSPYSPYADHCHSSNAVCTANDPEVYSAECDQVGGHATLQHSGCMHKGPAYNISVADIVSHYDGDKMWETQDQLRTMVDDRFNVQQSHDCGTMCWNEVIIDERLLLTQLWWDPATAVDAIVYLRGHQSAQAKAVQIQQSFKRNWGVEPPVVSADASCNVQQPDACGPFETPTLVI